MSGIKYQLICPEGFGKEGYHHCSLRMSKNGEGGKSRNVSASIVELWNARTEAIGDGEPDEACPACELILAHDKNSFFVNGSSFKSLEDLAEAIRLRVFGFSKEDYQPFDIECWDGGEETTLKVAGTQFNCDCGSDRFFRKRGTEGTYECVICGQQFSNRPPSSEE